MTTKKGFIRDAGHLSPSISSRSHLAARRLYLQDSHHGGLGRDSWPYKVICSFSCPWSWSRHMHYVCSFWLAKGDVEYYTHFIDETFKLQMGTPFQAHIYDSEVKSWEHLLHSFGYVSHLIWQNERTVSNHELLFFSRLLSGFAVLRSSSYKLNTVVASGVTIIICFFFLLRAFSKPFAFVYPPRGFSFLFFPPSMCKNPYCQISPPLQRGGIRILAHLFLHILAICM